MLGYIHLIAFNLVKKQVPVKLHPVILSALGLEQFPEINISHHYDRQQLIDLMTIANQELSLSHEEIYRLFSDEFIRTSKKLFPHFFSEAPSARAFLEKLETIHNLMSASSANTKGKCIFRQALLTVPSHFPDQLVMFYNSPMRLCGLFEALFHRLLAEYQEKGHISQRCCMHDGADHCEIVMTFTGAAHE